MTFPNPKALSRTDPSSLRRPVLRRGLVDAVGEAAEGQRLQPDLAGAGQGREEEPLAAEERRLHPADELDVVLHGRLQRHETAGIDAQRFARRQLQRVHHAAGVDEAETVAFEPLHDEAFAAEQADADLPLEGDANRHASRRAEERVLLADELTAERRQIEREDAARVRRGERDRCLPGRRRS